MPPSAAPLPFANSSHNGISSQVLGYIGTYTRQGIYQHNSIAAIAVDAVSIPADEGSASAAVAAGNAKNQHCGPSHW
jgi:hypothetical protein